MQNANSKDDFCKNTTQRQKFLSFMLVIGQSVSHKPASNS
jgi:hypothetical protein